MLRNLSSNPKRIFLIDGIGAFITSFFLFFVLRNYNTYFGLPKTTLSYLSIIAILFSIYSISCFYLLNKKWQFFLKAISIANILYCSLTGYLIIYYCKQITVLGLSYFILEISIILILAIVEILVLLQNKK
ncbi:MAG: hypothetical protein V4667_04730 [Bacteroidota bacterium]